jgi:small-conductance mechanosensitive channel
MCAARNDPSPQGASYRLKPSAILLYVTVPLLPLFGLVAFFAYWCLWQFAAPSWWQSVMYWVALAALYVSSTFSVARLYAQRILSGAGIVIERFPGNGGKDRG